MATYLTTGFILHCRPWRECDRIYTVYTKHFGKVDLLAAGSRKISSKLATHLLPFAQVDMMFARGRTFDRLAAAELRQIYLKPPYHLGTALLASALLEIVANLTQTNQPEPKLFTLLSRAFSDLAVLAVGKEDNWRHKARYKLIQFIIEILNITGLVIRLRECDVCGKQLTKEVSFSWSRHSFLHKSCCSRVEPRIELSDEAVKWFNYQWLEGINTAISPPVNVLVFLTDYLAGQINQELRSLKVLRSVL